MTGGGGSECSKRARRVGTARRLLVAMALLASGVMTSALSAPSPASAATEIDWFVATPGYIRTDLQTANIAMHPDGDRLFAVTGDGGERRLLLIDFADYSVLDEADIPESDVWDMEVSADGSVLFILDAAGVTRFDAETLDEEQFIEAAGGRDHLALAPDDNSVVALSRAGRIFRSGTEIDLIGTALEDATGFGFGATASELYATSYGDAPLKVTLVGSDVTVENSWTDKRLLSAGRFEFDNGVLVHGNNSSLWELDPNTMEIVTSTSSWRGQFVFDHGDRHLYSFSSNMGWVSEFGSTGIPVAYSFPSDATIVPLLAIGDGVVLANESSWDEPGRLIEVSPAVLASAYGDFHAITPDRIVDTRFGVGVDAPARIEPGETITFDVAGQGGVPEDGVLAVTMNATVTEPTGPGFVKIWPTGFARPKVSNLNYVEGQTVANGVTVVLGSDGALQLYNHANSAAHVIIDVTGYYSDATGVPGARYEPGARRVLDTRNATQGRFGKLGQGEYLDLYVPSYGWENIDPNPYTAAAVLNVTVANASRFSYLSVYPRDAPVDPLMSQPTTSTINFYPGDLRSNMTVSAVSAGGWVRVYNHGGSVDVIVDVVGHYVSPSPYEHQVDQAGRFYPTVPYRRLDTRESSPFDGDGSLTPRGILIMPGASGWTDIINLTVTEPTNNGYVASYGWSGQPPFGAPQTSSVNFVRDQTVANGVYAYSGDEGYAVENQQGNTHVIIDVFGYLTPERLEPIAVVFSQQASLVRDPVGTDGNRDIRALVD